jgi:hypothetical protein
MECRLSGVLDVLKILGLLAINVPGQVEVELVLLDLLDGDHTRVLREFESPVEHINNFVNVLGTKSILGTVLHEVCAGVDHEDTLAGVGIVLVDDDDAGRDSCAVEEVCGQTVGV